MFLSFLGWYWEGSSDTPPSPPDGGARPTGGNASVGWWVRDPRKVEAEQEAIILAPVLLDLDEAARIKRNKAIAALLLASA